MLRYLAQIWNCRFFWLSLVRNDLRGRYRRSILGVGWSLLRPIAFTIILCLVFQRLFHRSDVWSYAPYLLSGLTIWDYLVTATKQGCQCFFQGESYIRQCPTPVAIFPLRTALAETFHFLVSMFVLLGLSFYVNGTGHALALFSLIPAFVLLFLLAWALAIVAGFANVYFQDTQHLCDVVFQILFYATPIIYDARDLGGRLGWLVTHCNPLVPFLDLVRQPVLHGTIPSLESYALASSSVLALGTIASILCWRLQRQLIFRL